MSVRGRILLVEDDPEAALFAVTVLAKRGQFVSAVTGPGLHPAKRGRGLAEGNLVNINRPTNTISAEFEARLNHDGVACGGPEESEII